MSRPQIVEGRDYPIKPEDIDATRHFFEAFDHTETEISARWVVRLCQEKGHWGPFTEAELTAFYHREFPDSTFRFHRLVEPQMSYSLRGGGGMCGGGWLVREGDTLRVTHNFITRCFKASPAKKGSNP